MSKKKPNLAYAERRRVARELKDEIELYESDEFKQTRTWIPEISKEVLDSHLIRSLQPKLDSILRYELHPRRKGWLTSEQKKRIKALLMEKRGCSIWSRSTDKKAVGRRWYTVRVRIC